MHITYTNRLDDYYTIEYRCPISGYLYRYTYRNGTLVNFSIYGGV